MKFILTAIILNFFVIQGKPIILTENNVTKLILEEITGLKAEVDVVELANSDKPGLKSSDIFKINAANLFVFLSDEPLSDFLNISDNKTFHFYDFLSDSQIVNIDYGEVFDLYIDSLTFNIQDSIKLDSLNNYFYGDTVGNHHFYLDPLLVSEILPDIEKALSNNLPELSPFFKQNIIRFQKRLELLNKQISKELSSLRGMPVYSETPFLQYYIKRYNLQYAASLKTSFDFDSTYSKFILKDMNKIGINTIFLIDNLNNESFESINTKHIDAYANKSKYESYSDFMLKITRDIKNSLLFY